MLKKAVDREMHAIPADMGAPAGGAGAVNRQRISFTKLLSTGCIFALLSAIGISGAIVEAFSMNSRTAMKYQCPSGKSGWTLEDFGRKPGSFRCGKKICELCGGPGRCAAIKQIDAVTEEKDRLRTNYLILLRFQAGDFARGLIIFGSSSAGE